MERMGQGDVAEVGGLLSAVSGFGMCFVELVTTYTFNQYIQAILTVGGVVYLFYKIVNARLDVKLKKKVLEDEFQKVKKEAPRQKLFKRTKK